MGVCSRLVAAGLGAALLGSAAGPARGAPPSAQKRFERVATFAVCENTSCERGAVPLSAAEIAAASADGEIIVYSDGPGRRVGFVDIRDPERPRPLGALALAGEPTSVAVAGPWLLVAVNTSPSLTAPAGELAVYRLRACAQSPATCSPQASFALAGQPDSVAVSPDGEYAAIAIENERDEDVIVDGVQGGLPQLPAGSLQVLRLRGAPASWALSSVDLRGLSAYAPQDPEPEYVSINALNVAAVTLQENNHVVLVHLPTGRVVSHFGAGAVDLEGVDTEDDGRIEPDSVLAGVRREPDAIAWTGLGLLVTANEGDLFGGSRGFSLWSPFGGRPLFDSGVELEYLAMAHGHYPEARSDNKGTEPEGVAVARYGSSELLFVGAERGNFAAVYELRALRPPRFLQLLPSGIGPEGLLPIPGRGLLAIAAEEDEELRSTISLYRLRSGPPSYPTLVSEPRKRGALAGIAPIGWAALSALAADRSNAQRLFSAHDAALQRSRLYVIDVSRTPARITDEIELVRDGAPVNYDLEGLVQRADGSFWAVSEGSGSGGAGRPNLLLQIDASGRVAQEISLPPAVAALKRGAGLEGVAVTGSGPDERVYVAFQREWQGDPAQRARIGRYTPQSGEWAFFYYPLEAGADGAAIGLSELVALDDQTLLVLERDDRSGPLARVKRLYTVSLAGLAPQPQGAAQPFPVLAKRLVRDLLPDLAAPRGWLQEKIEGVAVAADGEVYAVTDNDGLDENTGETQFLRLGKRRRLGF